MAKRKKTSKDANELAVGYAQRTALPLQSLYFLLPLIVAYEAAMFIFYRGGQQIDIIARRTLQVVGEWLGIGDVMFYLPGPLIIGALVGMHFASKSRFDRNAWRFEPALYAKMWLETLAWTVPILLFGSLLLQATLAAPLQSATQDFSVPESMVLSVGAGLYEELLFRLIGIAMIHAILVDILALPEHIGQLGAVGVTALLFAWHHFLPDARPFDFRLFLFFTVAGIYLAWLYIARGFGIAAGTHAIYDITVVILAAIQRGDQG